MDTWGLRKQQDTVACMVRIQSNVAPYLFKCNEFEVIWQQAALKLDIDRARSQLAKLTRHGGLVGSST